MDYARRAVFLHGLPRVRDWALWTLRRPQLALWTVVTCGYLGWAAACVADFHFRLTDLVLFAGLLGCGACSVELTRRASEPAGVVKDVYAVWELPIVFLLPGIYGLIVPAIRIALTQWRVRRAPVYKRVYSVAAIGLAYGCARLVYLSVLPAGGEPRGYLWSHTSLWLAAAGAGAIAQWSVNLALIAAVLKLENPAANLRRELLSRETLHNDATEVCAALLVAVGMTISLVTLLVALPLATLLQRSFRHAQLLYEARADAKTGLLNAATWERESVAEVARAVRTYTPLAVALLDLDRFKQVNDNHGHLVGDEVLRAIAGTMTGMLRDYDLAGRFGGEEFVMLLPQTRAVDAFRIAERVREGIAALPVATSGGEPVYVTASIGVAALDAGANRGLPELLAAADAALYRAKASGRDQVQMISTSRGLSAVSPGAAPEWGIGGTWRGAAAQGGVSVQGGPAGSAGLGSVVSAGPVVSAGSAGPVGPVVSSGPEAGAARAVREASVLQLPADQASAVAGGVGSTATTSAFAV